MSMQERCVVCGRSFHSNHRCDPNLEDRINRGRTTRDWDGYEPPRTYHGRLKEGFEMLDEDGPKPRLSESR